MSPLMAIDLVQIGSCDHLSVITTCTWKISGYQQIQIMHLLMVR